MARRPEQFSRAMKRAVDAGCSMATPLFPPAHRFDVDRVFSTAASMNRGT
jgi:hypothetical protein